MSPLSKPTGDAIALQQVLEQAGWRVRCLGDRVTGQELEAALREFLERQAVGQDALIYFTGHGFMVEESEDDRRGYLASSDCEVEYEGERIVGQRRGLSFGRLNGLIGRARLSSLVVWLDCCHGGLFVEDGLVKRSFQASPEQNFCWVAACRSFQQAYARGGESHSLFTGALLEGLQSPGEVTVLSVLRQVNQAFRQLAMQEPIYIGAGKDIPLIAAGQRETVAIANPVNPYQGLRSFTKATRQFFFGRDREIQVLVRKVQEACFVPVIGASGSGKSSVVRAGLMPRLEELGWRVLGPIVPGTDPMEALRSAIEEVAVSPPSPQSWGDQADQVKTLLVVDQFEEVFTLCRDRLQQSKFIQALLNLDVRVVVTMRADFVEACLADEGLTRAIERDAVYLGAMTEEGLAEAIEQPAMLQGVGIQPKLLAQILQDVKQEENCLPLLEFALTELWERCSQNGPLAPKFGGTEPGSEFKAPSIGGLGAIPELTLAAYQTLGGVTGALNAHAEGIYKQLAKQKQEDLAKQILLKLVRTGEGTKDTRQRQRKADLLAIGNEEVIESVITTLVDGRLLVSDRIDGEDVIDLSHEALMGSWGRFVGWRESDRETRRLVDKIEDARREWQAQKQKQKYLLDGRSLKDARRLLKDKPNVVLGAKTFIQKSLWWRRSQMAGLLVIPILILGVPAEYFWREEAVKRDYDRIARLENGDPGERAAVLNLVGGCWSSGEYQRVPEYFRERVFGNCRSIQTIKLEKADLGYLNLSSADIRGANLSDAYLGGTNLSGADISYANLQNVRFGCGFPDQYCTNLKNIQWNKKTNWENIQGWETVENIPPALKQQLGLKNRTEDGRERTEGKKKS